MLEDATVADPDGHVVAFENEHVRIVEVRVPQGKKVGMHSHPPRALVAITPYRIKATDEEGRTTIVDRRPGEVGWSDGENHAAEILVGPAHTIEIEVKAAR